MYELSNPYSGVGVGFLVLFIIGTLLAGWMFDLGGIPIALRSSSGEGIPGVGVAPGFRGFLSSSGLGIPGVGVAPFGSGVRLAGMPGVLFADGGSGLAERPGGMLAGSRFTAVLTMVFPLLALLTVVALEQASASNSNNSKNDKRAILSIKKSRPCAPLERAVPA